ncbi:MAG: HAMP domain-containing protein [Ignavibacteriales bacterium]|nr:HAMP domain-containing protein [Ignavibacteriales bacterium]
MKRKLRISLKFKLTSLFTIVLGLISLFIYFYFPEKFEQERIQSLKEKANSVAKIAAYGVSSGFYLKDEKSSENEIESLIKNEEIRYVVIEKRDSLYYDFNYFTALMNHFKDIKDDGISGKWEIMKIHAPIMLGSDHIGDIYIGYSLRLVYANIEELRTNIGIVSLLLFLVGSILVYFIGMFFTKPLTEMVKTVNKISDGDYTQRAKVESSDEVGYLANSFNVMVDKIAATNEQMEVINKELEQRVVDRTVELERALRSLQKENDVRKKAEKEISKSLEEKEVLLKEIHHRVKNNLQIVSSLFFFQSKKITDPVTLEMFRDGQNRVKSMALIHERLYQSDDLANINFKEYVRKLANFLFQSYGVNQSKIKLKTNIANIELGVDTAVPCGLIINELISNSLKHGFDSEMSGEIRIDMGHNENNKLILKISDNGKGIPKDLNIEESDSLGLRLVNNLTMQLNGKVEFINRNGTMVKLIFEDPKYAMAS